MLVRLIMKKGRRIVIFSEADDWAGLEPLFPEGFDVGEPHGVAHADKETIVILPACGEETAGFEVTACTTRKDEGDVLRTVVAAVAELVGPDDEAVVQHGATTFRDGIELL